MSNSLWPHGPHHARLPCPSLSPRACSNSWPSSQWCIQSSHPLLSLSPPTFNLSQHQDLFQWVSSFHWESKVLDISPSNEYSGLLSFRIDWFDLLAVQGILKSTTILSISLQCSAFSQFSQPYMTTGKKHLFGYIYIYIYLTIYSIVCIYICVCAYIPHITYICMWYVCIPHLLYPFLYLSHVESNF